MHRPNWDEYLMGFAINAAKRGNCPRKQVGSVIVVERRVVATGYAGALAGMPTCLEEGHDMDDGHCVRTVHAEMNALCQAAMYGIAVKGGSVYSTTETCWGCFRVLVAAGIDHIVFLDAYTKHVQPGTSNHAAHRDRIKETISTMAKRSGRFITFRQLVMDKPEEAVVQADGPQKLPQFGEGEAENPYRR